MNRVVLICQLLLLSAIFLLQPGESAAQSRSGRSSGGQRGAVIIAKSKPVLVESIGRSRSVSSSSSSTSASGIEKEVFRLVNAKRREKGLAPLIWSDRIAEVARRHSKNMAQGNFFSHRGKDGSMVSSRASRAGVNWSEIGENIVFFTSSNDPAGFAVKNWMKSSGHKQNILDRRWQESGIGAAMPPTEAITLLRYLSCIRYVAS
jgi:uncharacterized protein YkwD